jgi:hypothetical protein
MRRTFILVAMGLLMSGCGKEPGPANLGQKSPWEAGEWIVGEPVTHANLTIFPLLSKKPLTDDRFITLDEGLKAGTVEVLEVGAAEAAAASEPAAATDTAQADEANQAQAAPADPVADDAAEPQAQRASNEEPQPPRYARNQVNKLVVINRSDRPLYLMPGEIVVGGQQDRVVGEEVVVQPGSKPVSIDVYCVEHGRWRDRRANEYANMHVALQSNPSTPAVADVAVDASEAAAKEAASGKFVASFGNLGKDARLAVIYEKNQGEVWNKVAEANAASGAKSDSGAYTANYAQDSVLDRLEPYLAKLEQPIAAAPRVVGVVVAINGKPECYDVFESTPLFKKLWPKLLKSAALDAANQAEPVPEIDAKPAACSREAAQKFVLEVLSVPVERSETTEGLTVMTRSSNRVMGFSAAPVGGTGGGGGAVHGGGGVF